MRIERASVFAAYLRVSEAAPIIQGLIIICLPRSGIQPVAGTVARRRDPEGFSLVFATRRAMLTGEPFDPTFFDTSVISEPNRTAHRCSKRL